MLLEFFEFTQRQFARQHHALDSEFACKLCAFRRSNRHLRARVNRQLRRDFPCEPHEAHVLHDQRIHARAAAIAQHLFRRVEFAGEDERVERHVCLHAVAVAELHDLHQLVVAEIVRAQPRIETRQAEVNGIRAIRDGGTQTVPATGGREEFGMFGICRHARIIARFTRNASSSVLSGF